MTATPATWAFIWIKQTPMCSELLSRIVRGTTIEATLVWRVNLISFSKVTSASQLRLWSKTVRSTPTSTGAKSASGLSTWKRTRVFEGSLLNWEIYKKKHTCDICRPGYYLKENECIAHTSDLGCDQFNRYKNECVTCPEKFQLSRLNFCEPIKHCREFSEDMRSCTWCDTEYFLEANTRKCHPRGNKSCKSFHPGLDQCESCGTNQYLDIEENYTCKQRSPSSGYCARWDLLKDICLECVQDRVLANSSRTVSSILCPGGLQAFRVWLFHEARRVHQG